METSSKKPKYVQAEEAIMEMVSSPEYYNGKLLPTEVELAKSLHMSRNTLRQAINKLVYEGVLCRRKGLGTWVEKRIVTSGVKNWLSFSQEMRKLGIEVRNYELHVSLEIPPEKVRNFFGMEETGEQYCLKLERVRGHKDFPFVVFVSYFNPKYQIKMDENFSLPLYEILEKNYGIVVHTSVEEISASLAGKIVSSKLKIPEEAPILRRKRFVYDVNGEPVEYNIGYYRADSFTYTITSER